MKRKLGRAFAVGLLRIISAWRRWFLVPMRRSWYRKIPTAMITGSEGKTTTSRMLAHILREADFTVGLVTTDGVMIGDRLVTKRDWAGYRGHRIALNDRSTTAAVLETARGGLLKWGLFACRQDGDQSRHYYFPSLS